MFCVNAQYQPLLVFRTLQIGGGSLFRKLVLIARLGYQPEWEPTKETQNLVALVIVLVVVLVMLFDCDSTVVLGCPLIKIKSGADGQSVHAGSQD